VFGAAASAGKLLGLSEEQMIWALGLAASQPVGLRESFGSMNKALILDELPITAYSLPSSPPRTLLVPIK
jgi:hypothetical protein